MSVTRPNSVNPPVRRLHIVTSLVALLALAGCQTSGGDTQSFFDKIDKPSDPVTTGSVDPKDNTLENTQKWARYWNANQKDTKAAIAYAAHLRALNKNDQALTVLRKTAMSNPQDTEILAAYGKQLAMMTQLPEASKVLYKATATGTPSWETLSVHGTVLDRLGKHQEARTQYQAALKVSPGNTTVMNNLAMSYAVSGDPKQAEDVLLKAIAKSGGQGNGQLQQNLALVLALQGKFDRARKVLAKVLPPHKVDANMAFIKKMISQRNTWQQIQAATPES